MIMSRKIFAVLFCFLFASIILAGQNELQHLTRTDPQIDTLRKEISSSIYIIKSGREYSKLPELNFYTYTVKDGDNIWNIIARTSLDMDTLLTVNRLESPSDITLGRTIYIPNMRGIVISISEDDTLDSISAKYNIDSSYITHVNRMEGLSKSHIFIPCGQLTTGERTVFLASGFTAPVNPVRVTSGFGMRNDPFLKIPRFHSGVDIRCSTGTPVKASKGGTVTFAGYMEDYGNLVIISHDNGFESYYGHLHKIEVAENQSVKRGAVIAYSGNTGRSTGPHLHFEIRKDDKPINPLKKISVK